MVFSGTVESSVLPGRADGETISAVEAHALLGRHLVGSENLRVIGSENL